MADRPATELGERLAGELDAARRTLEELALRLCLDPVVFERHAEPLQQFDQLGQVIGEVATILRTTASAPHAIGAVRLEAMRDRLAG